MLHIESKENTPFPFLEPPLPVRKGREGDLRLFMGVMK